VSIAAITLCVASQRVFIVVVYFVNDSVRKLRCTLVYDDINTSTLWYGTDEIWSVGTLKTPKFFILQQKFSL